MRGRSLRANVVTTAAAVVLVAVLASLPGALALSTTSSPALERMPRPTPRGVTLPGTEVAGAEHVAPVPAPAPEVAAPVAPDPAPLADEVPIAPPPERFDGPVAAAAAPPPQLADVEPTPPTDGVRAVIIGIDDYPGRSADLEYAVADADALDLALAGFGVPAEQRLVLRDGQADRQSILDAVAWLVDGAGPDSTAVLLFAGHVRSLGGGTEALVSAEGGLITDDELAIRLGALSARHAWIVVAACFGGGFTELLAPGRVLTAAAPANSLAYENRAIGGSYLIHHMVREGWLQGAAGPSVQEAFAAADAAIARDHPHRRPVQYDEAGEPVRLDGALGTEQPAPTAPPSQPAPGQPAGSSPPTTAAPPPAEPAPSEPDSSAPGMGRQSSCLICRRG